MEEVIRRIKNSGNFYFSKKNFVDAGRKYKKALRYYLWMCQQKDMPDTINVSDLTDLKSVLLLNLAAVYLKRKEYRNVIHLCNEASKHFVIKSGRLYCHLNILLYLLLFFLLYIYNLIQVLEQYQGMDNTKAGKALFRRGQAYSGLNEYNLGMEDLERAFKICPNDKDIIIREIKKIKKLKNSYLEFEKTTCQKMFH